MHSLEEKNHLSNEIERMKKKVEEGEQNKARLQSQLEAQNLEIYNLKLFGQQQQQQNTNYNSVEYRYVITVWQLKLIVFLFSPIYLNTNTPGPSIAIKIYLRWKF